MNLRLFECFQEQKNKECYYCARKCGHNKPEQCKFKLKEPIDYSGKSVNCSSCKFYERCGQLPSGSYCETGSRPNDLDKASTMNNKKFNYVFWTPKEEYAESKKEGYIELKEGDVLQEGDRYKGNHKECEEFVPKKWTDIQDEKIGKTLSKVNMYTFVFRRPIHRPSPVIESATSVDNP